MTTRTFIIAAFASLGIASTGLGERGGQFSVEQKLTASDAAESDYFGQNVSISGNTALAGAFYDDDNGSNSGSVYVYQLLGDGTWSEVQKLTASDAAEHDNFGQDVAISGDTILIGSVGDDDNGTSSGSAYLYQRQDDGTWSESQKLTASDGASSDRFSRSLAISGDMALIGAYSDDDNSSQSGSAYLYQRQDDGTWSEVQKLTASDASGGDNFGRSVSISGETALVGAYLDGDNGADSGSAYLYQQQDDGTWSEVQKLTASDGAENDFFGQNVAISDDTILIGSAYDDDNGSQSGSAYLYQRQDDGTWSEVQKLTASDASGSTTFGNSVAISGTTALVGAYYDYDNGANSGSAYLYQQQDDGTWSEVQKLTASDGAGGEFFGQDVAISGDTVLIGADRDDDNGSRSGSAYLYYSPTPAATGACCVNTGCDILTLSQCWNLGGVYMAGTSCDECDTVCLPDINGDGTVGVVDLLEVIDAWGICP